MTILQPFPVFLAVSLPGLGHIYLKKHGEGLVYFGVFILLLFIPHGFWGLPILALASGYRVRALMRGVELSQSRTGRASFALGAILSATLWLGVLFSNVAGLFYSR